MAEELDDTIDTAIEDAVTSPKSITVDGTQTTERDVSELIDLARFNDARQFTGAPWGALRTAQGRYREPG